MREIKIEVLFKIHNKDFTTSIAKHYTSVDRLMSGADSFDYENNEVIAKRLFTGLIDVNGSEIYSEDIVRTHFYGEEFVDGALVSYDSSLAKFVFNDGDGEQDGFISGAEFGLLEIIGNIHQNPELLERS